MASVLYGAPILPEAEEFTETEEYSEEHRGKIGKELDRMASSGISLARQST